jgi:hypothetical protein
MGSCGCRCASDPAAPTITIVVQGTCDRYEYRGVEAGLRQDFQSFWSAHSFCAGHEYGNITVTQDLIANTITWSWQNGGSASQSYTELSCP